MFLPTTDSATPASLSTGAHVDAAHKIRYTDYTYYTGTTLVRGYACVQYIALARPCDGYGYRHTDTDTVVEAETCTSGYGRLNTTRDFCPSCFTVHDVTEVP